MSAFLTDTWYLFLRLARATTRMPVFLIISIVQPIFWLVLFGQLFHSVTTIPGFEGGGSYLDFITPGVAVMTAVFSSAYAGMSLLGEIDQGVLDRMLATPVARGALIAGRLLYSAVQVMVQSLVILTVSTFLGVRAAGGVLGILLVLVAASLLGAAFAGFSCALALTARRQEIIIAASNFTVTPMIFASSMLMEPRLMPVWLARVARFNPFNWGVVVARSGFHGAMTPASWTSLALLAAIALLCGRIATRAFVRYQRSM